MRPTVTPPQHSGLAADLSAVADARKLSEKIKKKGGKDLKAVKENLVDHVWGSARPSKPNKKVVVQSHEYAGKSVDSKLGELRKEIDKRKCASFIVCE